MDNDCFKFYRPSKILKPFVRYYWTTKNSQFVRALTYPIGCPQIIFHRGVRCEVEELHEFQDRFAISGQVNFPAHLRCEGGIDMFVIVFYPHTMSAFLNVPTSEFINREIPGYDLGNRSLNELADSVFACKDDDQTVRIIEGWLIKHLYEGLFNHKFTPELNLKRIGASLNFVYVNPKVSVTDLAEISCVGKKQFERLFYSYVGMNPKEYMKIVRFQRSLFFMQYSDIEKINFANIAYLAGYADQSHFIREFRQYSGLTPKLLLKEVNPYSDLFTDPLQ